MNKPIFQLLRMAVLIGGILTSYYAAAGVYDDMLRAVNLKDASTVAQLLQRGMDVNTSDPSGNTLLMLSARNGDFKTLQLLLRNKANVLKINKYNDSALLLAALQGNLEIVAALVKAGADINPGGWTPLIYAAFQGNSEVVQFLLTLPVDIDAQAENGTTALMAACRNNHVEIVKILIQHDADMDLKNQDNQTALDMATQGGHSEIVNLLKQ